MKRVVTASCLCRPEEHLEGGLAQSVVANTISSGAQTNHAGALQQRPSAAPSVLFNSVYRAYRDLLGRGQCLQAEGSVGRIHIDCESTWGC